jgi:hypothetical protein
LCPKALCTARCSSTALCATAGRPILLNKVSTIQDYISVGLVTEGFLLLLQVCLCKVDNFEHQHLACTSLVISPVVWDGATWVACPIRIYMNIEHMKIGFCGLSICHSGGLLSRATCESQNVDGWRAPGDHHEFGLQNPGLTYLRSLLPLLETRPAMDRTHTE